MLSEAKKYLRDKVTYGVITKDKRKELLQEPEQYRLKIVGLDEYIINESLPLYPLHKIPFSFSNNNILK
jgi:hypothetical protein